MLGPTQQRSLFCMFSFHPPAVPFPTFSLSIRGPVMYVASMFLLPKSRKWDMFSAAYIDAHMSWRWVYGIWGIVGIGLTVIYVVLVPETRGGVILSARAQRARQAGHKGAWAIHEKLGCRSARQILRETVLRPASNSPSRSIL